MYMVHASNLTNSCYIICQCSFVNLPENGGNLSTASQLRRERKRLQGKREALKLQLMVIDILFLKI